MKFLMALMGILFAFGALAVEKPVYKKSDTSLYGAYENKANNNSYSRIDYIEYREDENGEPMVYLGSGRRAFYYEVTERDGKLYWGGYHDGECDDPGCGYISNVEGTIEPIKYRGKYVPHIKMTITETFDYPDEEDAPRGDHDTKVILRRTKGLDHSVPYYRDMDKQEVPELTALATQCSEAKHSAFRDLVFCTKSKSWQFRKSPRGKVFDKFLAEEINGKRENLLKVKTEEDIRDGFLVLLEAGIRHGAAISRNKKEVLKSARNLEAFFEELQTYLIEDNLGVQGISLYLVIPKYGGINDLSDAKLLIVNYKAKQIHRLEYKSW